MLRLTTSRELMSLKESVKKLFKLSNGYQSEYKLLKSNYDSINYKSVIEDENKLYVYKEITTVGIFDLVFETFIIILMILRLGLLEQDLAYKFSISPLFPEFYINGCQY